MNIIAVSINHKTAPVELIEALHLDSKEIKELLDDSRKDILSEGFVLSTCNRTEIYGFPKSPEVNYIHLEKVLLEKKNVNGIKDEHFHKYFSCSALNHIFKVAAGIDSQLIGDNQIFGQVKEAFHLAEERGAAGFMLKRVFDAAIKVGKRAKSETEISEGAITVSYAAVQLIEKIFSSLNKKSALVIGMGETGLIAAKHLKYKKSVIFNLTTLTY